MLTHELPEDRKKIRPEIFVPIITRSVCQKYVVMMRNGIDDVMRD